MNDEPLTLQLTTIEVAQLGALVRQFSELVGEPDPADAGISRLVPDAYPDDRDASDEFSRLTRDDILQRRAHEAGVLLASLGDDIPAVEALDDDSAAEVRFVVLSRSEASAWMRTLAAVRLVLATRLGIENEDEDEGTLTDPRYVLYDWLGAILDGLVRAIESTP